MHVWIENPFDNLPAEGFRAQRFWLMARAFVRAGHTVTLWTCHFNHTTKQNRRLVTRPVLETDPANPARKLPEFVEEGIRVVLISAPPYARNVSLARIHSHRCYAKRWEAYARLRADALGHPDLIVVSTPPLATGDVAIRLARHWGAKLVVDIMDDWPGTFYRLLPRGLRGLGRLLFASAHRAAHRLYAAADLVTGCSDRYGELARAAGARDFFRAYHGIEMESVSSPVCATRASTGDGLSLLYLGNLGRTYDLTTVLAAVERLPNVTLDIAGAGAQEALVRSVSSPKVRFHGYCDAGKMSGLLAQADVGLVPMAPESCVGIPYKLADYARAGLAIASSLGGESGELLARYGAGEAYQGGDPDSLVAAIERLRVRLDEAKATSCRMAETEFDAQRIYADYVARVTREVGR